MILPILKKTTIVYKNIIAFTRFLKKNIMKTDALVYCENEFGNIDGKVANGLTRQSGIYNIIGIIDSSKVGQDAGEYLDGVKNGIPIFESLESALKILNNIPQYFIYGIAPLTSFLSDDQKEVIFSAM